MPESPLKMQKTIGFLILRDTFLKTMGSLIVLSSARDYRIILFYQSEPTLGEKAYQSVTLEKLASFNGPNIRKVAIRLTELEFIGGKYSLDALVVEEGLRMLKPYLHALAKLREAGLKMISLPHFFEVARNPIEYLKYFDKTYYLSEFARDLHLRLNAKTLMEFDREYFSYYEVSGSPLFDQIPKLSARRNRADFGIPEGKKVVVLFAPVISAVTPWRFYIWKEKNRAKRILRILKDRKLQYLFSALNTPSFEEIVQAIREFCDKHEALLVIKSRPKQDVPKYLVQNGDMFVSGREDKYFPAFTSFSLSSFADLCITSMSMAVVESVAVGTPVINIVVPHIDVDYRRDAPQLENRAYLKALMNPRKIGPFNFPGCVTAVDGRNIIKWLRKTSLPNISQEARAADVYREKFLGISETPSSERILNSLEKMLSISEGSYGPPRGELAPKTAPCI